MIGKLTGVGQYGLDVEISEIPFERKKEAGIDGAMVSFLLSQVQVKQLPNYLLVPVARTELESYIRALREAFARLALPG